MPLYTIDLEKGWNYISLQAISEIPKASVLADLIGSECTTILYWDIENQCWGDAYIPLVGSIDFDIRYCSDGYLLWMTDASTLTITGTACSVSLDDLLRLYACLGMEEAAIVGPGANEISLSGSDLEGKVFEYVSFEPEVIETVKTLIPGHGYVMERSLDVEDELWKIGLLFAAGGAMVYGIFKYM